MRVIAGRFKSRTLTAPAGKNTRPTADRVREAVFSVLGDVSELSVLDLYAGSGALGIEALSRGARHATFVEADARALSALHANLSRLGLENQSSVVRLKVERSVSAVERFAPYDLVFADPPWSQLPAAAEDVFRLLARGLLGDGAQVLIEQPTRASVLVPPGSGFVQVGKRSWGDTQVGWYAREMARFP